MESQSSQNLAKFVVFGVTVAAIPITFFSVLAISELRMLSGVVTGFVTLSILCLGKLILSRGKLSLLMLAVVLPLIVAMFCFGLVRLLPFLERHAALNDLERSKIQFRVHVPDRAGEWLQDRSGNMMPSWFVGLIGQESLHEVRSISGNLGDLQSIRYAGLANAQLTRVVLKREEQLPPISGSLIDWLNSCERLERLELVIKHCSDEDLEALSRIDPLKRFRLDISFEAADTSLRSVEGWQNLAIRAPELSVENARRLTQTSGSERLLILDCENLPVESIREMSQRRAWSALSLANCKLDQAQLSELSRIQVQYLGFWSVQFPPELEEPTSVPTRTHRAPWQGQSELSVFSCSLKTIQLQQLARRFASASLSTDQPLNEADFELLWSVPNLQEVHASMGGAIQRRTHRSRPDENRN